jgi:hypothetical protein
MAGKLVILVTSLFMIHRADSNFLGTSPPCMPVYPRFAGLEKVQRRQPPPENDSNFWLVAVAYLAFIPANSLYTLSFTKARSANTSHLVPRIGSHYFLIHKVPVLFPSRALHVMKVLYGTTMRLQVLSQGKDEC